MNVLLIWMIYRSACINSAAVEKLVAGFKPCQLWPKNRYEPLFFKLCGRDFNIQLKRIQLEIVLIIFVF